MELVKRNGQVEMSVSGSMNNKEMQVRTNLYLAGFGVSASEISTRLDLKPTRTSEKSPLREKHKKSGFVSWTLCPETDFEFSDEAPEESLQRILKVVEGKSEAIQSLKPAVRAELVLGVHLGDDSASELRIAASTLGQISELGLDLVLSIVAQD